MTILTKNFCTIAFQLLIYQKEFFSKFSKNLQNTFNLIKSTKFQSATIKFRERQIRLKSVDFDYFFFSANWVINKSLLRSTIKQFLFDILAYRNAFRETKESEDIFTFPILTFTEEKLSQLFLISTFNRHLKNDSSISNDILIIWSNINNLCKDSIDTLIMSEQIKSSRNILSNLDLTSKQMQILSKTILTIVDTKINRLKMSCVNCYKHLHRFISRHQF